MKVGLVGLAGSGKSTLFDVLTGERSGEGRDPTASRVATVTLSADERFLWLADLYQPKKRSPAQFTLSDYPGLPSGGETEGRARISALRDEVEGLLLVVRGFTTSSYFYPRPEADPSRDARDLVSELLLADLEVVVRRIEKLETSVKRPGPKQEEEKRELALLKRLEQKLEEEVPVKAMGLTPDEEKMIRSFSLLSAKPWALLVSLADEVTEGEGDVDDLGVPCEARMAVRVRLEAELLDLEPEERGPFMEELGVEELRLPRFLDRLLRAMGRILFYTVGEKEVHAWELPEGATAVDAAGSIHTDLARGFIRAEVVGYDDFREAGDMRAAKAAGHFRLEGKDYVVKDGDIIEIRFSV